MSKTFTVILGVLVLIVGVIASSALFTVSQTEQALVMQFGKPKSTIREPGLNVKIPFIQNVVYFDNRVLDLDPPAGQVILADQKRINVDAFARYRITDPLRFFQALRTETAFRDQVGRILNSSVRNSMARNSLSELLSEKRNDIMNEIKARVAAETKDYGIEIVDVRIGRTDLPPEISQNVYNRMRSERVKEANQLRADGGKAKLTIESQADRKRTVIIAEAERLSQILRGEGDALRNQVLGEAYSQDPEFFAFYRSMTAYREALAGGDTNLVLSPNSDFFRFFGDQTGKK
ncbi:protease modulator HflC [Magnetovibrio blakemorei]|uniref:Protein HflC n=1 Tax=Magnetovibrio blakemorei TaxID=28181 RepID=A0A1E5Q9N6_9PROT|nr:protease modulator HflC [Magnetovibrio blakemorei]OEJ67838.1 protease modulator HflC [Magnetovibrio blakemorei]